MAQQVKNLPAMLVTWQGVVNGNGMKMEFMEILKFFLNFLFYIGVELINSVVIVSDEQ